MHLYILISCMSAARLVRGEVCYDVTPDRARCPAGPSWVRAAGNTAAPLVRPAAAARRADPERGRHAPSGESDAGRGRVTARAVTDGLGTSTWCECYVASCSYPPPEITGPRIQNQAEPQDLQRERSSQHSGAVGKSPFSTFLSIGYLLCGTKRYAKWFR